MKKILIICIFFLFLTKSIFAAVPNNKFGIHLAQPNFEDLESAAKLINSKDGDWGYVTLVIQEDDRKKEKWQEVFNQLRKLHLIPIIRLATKPEGALWRRPNKDEAGEWADFLDSLNWVTKDRYIILFNEPNHGAEWGGAVDVKNYSEVAVEFAKRLKEKNPDFFIMLAGLDASAPNSYPKYEDEQLFLQDLFNNVTIEQFNNLFSGLASHSYPNPAFAGSPWDYGRGSVRTYQWELGLLKEFGVKKELPVFITETGWRRGSEQLVADNITNAYNNIWLPDSQVKAVTPFILNYQGSPFLDFSWQKFQSNDFYQPYYSVQDLTKIKGEPIQKESGEIDFKLPGKLVASSTYQFNLRLKNTGQGYWDKSGGYQLSIETEKKTFSWLIGDIKNIMPFEERQIAFLIKTNDQLGKKNINIFIQKNNQKIFKSDNWQFEILPLPSLDFTIGLFPKLNDQGTDFEIQVFDKNQNLVFQKKNQTVGGGNGILNDIQNIVIGEEYRIVVLKPYYLPRQGFVTFKQNNNKIIFKSMLPIDFDTDGKLSFNDFITLLKNPKLLKLLII